MAALQVYTVQLADIWFQIKHEDIQSMVFAPNIFQT